MIPITKPSLDISDLRYIKKVIKSKILTDGYFQKKTEELIKKLINSKFVSLTQSCTAALEIASILINLKKGDEVIMPSYGFVSVANSVVLRNAKPVFAFCIRSWMLTLKEPKTKINVCDEILFVLRFLLFTALWFD